MADKIVESVHAVIDAIITDYSGQFPDGPDFLNELETELKYYIEDGEIDEWALHPHSDDGWKLVMTKDGEEHVVLRESDGGRK